MTQKQQDEVAVNSKKCTAVKTGWEWLQQ